MTWAPDRVAGEPRGPEPARPPASATAVIARGGLEDYAAASPLQVLRGLDSTPRGLDESAAQARLVRHGDNTIAAGGQPGWPARSLFTGESQPAAKRASSVITASSSGSGGPAPVTGTASVFDSPCLCLMGTSVVSGSATAVVVATGARGR